MLKDITLGQFFPGHGPIHRLDPRAKIMLTMVFVVAIFLAKSIAAYTLVLAFVILCVVLSGVPVRIILKGLKPIVYVVVFAFVLNVFFSAGQTVIWQWRFIRLTAEGITAAAYMAIRLVFLVTVTSLLTLTTSPISLTDGMERLMAPLKIIHFPAHELAMMMTIALRFIPTLLEETDKIMKAQMARGADFESGNLLQRAKAMLPLLVPLFVSAFRRADELAMAMEARCYRGGEGRTRMRVLHLGLRDAVATLLLLGLVAGLWALRV